MIFRQNIGVDARGLSVKLMLVFEFTQTSCNPNLKLVYIITSNNTQFCW